MTMKFKQKIKRALVLVGEKRFLNEGFESEWVLGANSNGDKISILIKIDFYRVRKDCPSVDDIGRTYISKKIYKNCDLRFFIEAVDSEYIINNWRPFMDFKQAAKTWQYHIKDFLNSFEENDRPEIIAGMIKAINSSNSNESEMLYNTIKKICEKEEVIGYAPMPITLDDLEDISDKKNLNNDENFIEYMWQQLGEETDCYLPGEMLRVMKILEKTKKNLKTDTLKEEIMPTDYFKCIKNELTNEPKSEPTLSEIMKRIEELEYTLTSHINRSRGIG